MLSRLPSRLGSSALAARTAAASSSALSAPRTSLRALAPKSAQACRTTARMPARCISTCAARLFSDSPAVVSPPATSEAVRSQSIVLTLAGPDRTGIVHDVTQTLSSSGANVEESRMTILGNDFAVLLRVTVPEHESAEKIAAALQAAFPGFVVNARATATHPIFSAPVRIFSVAVEGPDQPGIVGILTKLFLEHKGSVRDLDTDTSNALFAGYKIFSLKSVVALPINADFASFEASLHKFEDEYGFDVEVNEGMNEDVEGEHEQEPEQEEEPEQEHDEDEQRMQDPRMLRRGASSAPPPRGYAAPPPQQQQQPSAAASMRRGPGAAPSRGDIPPMPMRSGPGAGASGRDMGRPGPGPMPPMRGPPATSTGRPGAPPGSAARSNPMGPIPTGPSRGRK